MNNQIQKLAKQAFDTANYPADQKYKIEPNPVFCEKFAELIVRECIAAVEGEALAYAEPTWAMEIVNNLYETFELK